MNHTEADNVLAMHHKHNCTPHLPSSLWLLTAQHLQTSSGHQLDALGGLTNKNKNAVPPSSPAMNTSTAPLSSAIINPKPQPSHENPTPPPSVEQNIPVSPATEGSEPWQLHYYDPPTHDIIEWVKQFSHIY